MVAKLLSNLLTKRCKSLLRNISYVDTAPHNGSQFTSNNLRGFYGNLLQHFHAEVSARKGTSRGDEQDHHQWNQKMTRPQERSLGRRVILSPSVAQDDAERCNQQNTFLISLRSQIYGSCRSQCNQSPPGKNTSAW